MLYRFSIVFLIGLCLVACSSGSMQEESVPVIRFKPDEEGVQKGKIPPCRIGYLISVSNRDTNKSRVPNTFWTPSGYSLARNPKSIVERKQPVECIIVVHTAWEACWSIRSAFKQ